MKPLEPHITVRAVEPVVAGLEALGHDVKPDGAARVGRWV